MALQTREQHIKREKQLPTSAPHRHYWLQWPASMPFIMGRKVSKYSKRIHSITTWLNKALTRLGYVQHNELFFDTLRFSLPDHVSAQKLRTIALSKEVNLRYYDNGDVGFSIDETTDLKDVNLLLSIFSIAAEETVQEVTDIPEASSLNRELRRRTSFLTHEVFNKYHTETEMMRYIKRLERKDISLAHSMISLGSCTMKLNAASEMLPLSNLGWMAIHPLAPEDQTKAIRH